MAGSNNPRRIKPDDEVKAAIGELSAHAGVQSNDSNKVQLLGRKGSQRNQQLPCEGRPKKSVGTDAVILALARLMGRLAAREHIASSAPQIERQRE